MDIKMLKEFYMTVRNECVLNENFFTFFDIPDLILRKKVDKNDYPKIIKMLNHVKKLYLENKFEQTLGRGAKNTSDLTDEDLVPLILFDEIL